MLINGIKPVSKNNTQKIKPKNYTKHHKKFKNKDKE